MKSSRLILVTKINREDFYDFGVDGRIPAFKVGIHRLTWLISGVDRVILLRFVFAFAQGPDQLIPDLVKTGTIPARFYYDIMTFL
jgi:hypothetical protein